MLGRRAPMPVRSCFVEDGYAPTAGAYDLFNLSARPGQLAALAEILPHVRPEVGPVLDVGAGSGLNVAAVLEQVPQARVLALEPSRAMRSLLLGRIAGRPEWFDRVTVRPEDFFSAPLPSRLGAAILLGVIGHFDSGERAAVLAELGARLPAGGMALLDLQAPQRPERVEAFEFTAATIGDLTYRGIADAWPVDTERMRWRMTYLTLDGERVLVEDTTEHEYRHPAPERVRAEAEEVGLHLRQLRDTTYWTLTRM